MLRQGDPFGSSRCITTNIIVHDSININVMYYYISFLIIPQLYDFLRLPLQYLKAGGINEVL